MTGNTRRIAAYARQAGVLTPDGLPDTGRYRPTPAQDKRMGKKTRRHFATPSRLLANADRATARAGRAARLEDAARRFLGTPRAKVKITPAPLAAAPRPAPGATPKPAMPAVTAGNSAGRARLPG